MSNTFKCTFNKRFKTLIIENELFSLKFSNISTSYCKKVFPNNLESISDIETLNYDVEYINNTTNETLKIMGSNFLTGLFHAYNDVLYMQKAKFSYMQSMSDTEIQEAEIAIPFDGAFDYYLLVKNFDKINANHTYDIIARIYESSDKDYVADFTDLNIDNLRNIYTEISKLLNYLILKHNSSNQKEFERRKYSSKVLRKNGENVLKVNNSKGKPEIRDRKAIETLGVGDSVYIDYIDEKTGKDSYACGYEIDKIGKDCLEIIRKDNKCIRLKIRYDLIGEIHLEKEL